MDATFAFFLSILSGIIANLISNKLNLGKELGWKKRPKILFETINDTNKEEIENIRLQNREAFNYYMQNFFFYMITFIIIGASLFYPLMFHNGIGLKNIDFNKTKLALDVVLNKENFILASAIFSLLLYIPVLYVSSKIVNFINSILYNFQKITSSKTLALRVLTIFFLALFIAANVNWILRVDIIWVDSIKYTFLFVLFIFLVAGK